MRHASASAFDLDRRSETDCVSVRYPEFLTVLPSGERCVSVRETLCFRQTLTVFPSGFAVFPSGFTGGYTRADNFLIGVIKVIG